MEILIVTAHPDDDILFFGGFILTFPQHKYTIVCATYKPEDKRGKETLNAFQAYKEYGVKLEEGIMLGNLDTIEGGRNGIKSSDVVEQLLKYNFNPDLVLTHNKNGDYGHNGHKEVNRAVRKIFPMAWEVLCNDCPVVIEDKLQIEKQDTIYVPITPRVKEIKERIFTDCYVSQSTMKKYPLFNWLLNNPCEMFGR